MSTSENRPATPSPATLTEFADVVPISSRSDARLARLVHPRRADGAALRLNHSRGDLDDQLTDQADLLEDLARQVEDTNIDLAARIFRVAQLCRGLAGWAKAGQ